MVETFSDCYPAVDVIAELRKIRAWCMSNPTDRKTRRGAMRFVNSWLEREQNKGHRPNGATHATVPADGPSPAAMRRLGS
jgi:hypothetical protein